MNHDHDHDHGTTLMPMNTTMNHHMHPNTSMNHGDHNMPDDHMGHDMNHMMQMYFHTGVSEYILFEKAYTSTTGGMVGACFVMFALSILYEGLKFTREHLLRRAAARSAVVYTPSVSANSREQMVGTVEPSISAKMLSCSHVVQTLLHMLQVFLSYCLMLVFMTFNVWLCLAIILGAGCGYFLFGWRRAMVVDINEHCH
ncbi:hypothetical protein C0Q70_18117 [Pomacea canaliculata]|uniref:Copper transport protein n=1 Tax=Pomacea canaliculata TaxID=400727 RepID=A0A2T7NMB7_POMCA|nr:high affinity copper uptake protein 1-like [Pomacea canaliculata]PVD22308.1 hypothetical protein C0Q70_18117 [Pomacea canaliculata]